MAQTTHILPEGRMAYITTSQNTMGVNLSIEIPYWSGKVHYYSYDVVLMRQNSNGGWENIMRKNRLTTSQGVTENTYFDNIAVTEQNMKVRIDFYTGNQAAGVITRGSFISTANSATFKR